MKRSEAIGAVPREQSVQCCVVFDSTNGTIHHVHEVVTLEGAEGVSDYEVEQTALNLAAERGLDSSALKAIHVNPEELAPLAPGEGYAVDTDKLTLVRLESRPPFSEEPEL